jgi:hypothetical protein
MSVSFNKGNVSINRALIYVNPTQFVPEFKISVIEGTNTILYEDDDINNVKLFLDDLTITNPITVQFNSNDTFILNSGSWNINYSNGSNLFTVKSLSGYRATVNGQALSNTVVTLTSNNIVWDGVNVASGFTSNSDLGGTIIRFGDNQSNITIKNCLLKYGFVGIRGTTDVTGLTIDNVTIEEVNEGSIRIGGGFFSNPDMYEDFDLRTSSEYDLHDVSVTNITCYDTLDGGNVPNTTEPYSPLILIKMTENLVVDNIKFSGVGNRLAIEDSTNVSINRVLVPDKDSVGYGISVTGTDIVTISNSFIKTISGSSVTISYLAVVRNLKLIQNTFVGINLLDNTNFTALRRILKVVGNLTSGDNNGLLYFSIATDINGTPYIGSLSEDFQEENNNVAWNNQSFSDQLYVGNVLSGGTADLRVRSSGSSGTLTPATYRSTYSGYGVNTSFIDTGFVELTTRTNPDSSTSGPYYLPSTYSSTNGRNMITSSVDPLAEIDCAGYERVYPTDAGAFDRDATTLG